MSYLFNSSFAAPTVYSSSNHNTISVYYYFDTTIIYNYIIFYVVQLRIMVKEDKESEVIEHGDIFFFYRPKVATQEVKDIEDVQRFYMATSPEEGGRKDYNNNNKDIYRLFLVGQKQLPEIVEGKSTS